VPEESFNSDVRTKKSEKRFILLTHGTIEERYGHEVLIQALPLLREQIDHLHCYIVGEGGAFFEKIKSLSILFECADLITFTGYVPFSRIKDYIVQADLGIVPFLSSPFAELCQPNKLFEYVALKKPVVISRLKAIEESFDDSCVMFCKPGESEDLARCILDLYHHPEKRQKLANNAYRVYENLKWNETKKIYLQDIEKVLNKC
jgi:glycosyltransferase involved in cell wall biosynthesis